MMKEEFMEHFDNLNKAESFEDMDFTEDLSEFVKFIATQSMEHANTLVADAKIMGRVEDHVNVVLSHNRDHFRRVISKYEKMQRCYNSTVDRRRQLVGIDWGEKTRLFLFRIITAVGIGAVILLVGFVAKELQIPLPLLRIM